MNVLAVAKNRVVDSLLGREKRVSVDSQDSVSVRMDLKEITQLKDTASQVLLSIALNNGAEEVPPGPFAELLKRAAQFGQVPSCLTCRFRDITDEHTCTMASDPLQWHPNLDDPPVRTDNGYGSAGQLRIRKSDHFCAEWNPDK